MSGERTLIGMTALSLSAADPGGRSRPQRGRSGKRLGRVVGLHGALAEGRALGSDSASSVRPHLNEPDFWAHWGIDRVRVERVTIGEQSLVPLRLRLRG
jgi:hypothetical protein